MSEADAAGVLAEIRRLLEPHPDVVQVEGLKPDELRAAVNGCPIAVTCEVSHDPGAHPSLAHVHIQVRSEHASLCGPFDACLVGVNADRTMALHQAARAWFQCAAGPILSLFHGRPIFESAHFDGTHEWGVPGAHGFAGPLMVRSLRGESFEADTMAERPFFTFALEAAPPGLAHLVKVTARPRDDDSRLWNRTVEIDGHVASYLDAGWNPGVEGKRGVIATRFATFHLADQPDVLAARRQLDEVILAYVEVFAELRDLEPTQQRLLEQGLPEQPVDRVHHFLTLALGWSLITSRMPVESPTTYQRAMPNGELSAEIPLMSEPAYARGVAMSDELSRGRFAEGVKELALSSAAVGVVNQALDNGSKLENVAFAPFLIPDPGTNSAAFDAAMAQLRSQLKNRASPARRWWKFW